MDSALKTAYSIMDSWRRNYVKGKRKRSKPAARGLFLRVKQTLCRLENDKLRITIDGKENMPTLICQKGTSSFLIMFHQWGLESQL